jgi:putative oxidoreductase
MNMLKCECAKSWGDVAPLVLRVVAGLVFLMHGLQKTADIAGFTGFLSTLGVPMPVLLGWLVVILEVGGGIALIVGFMTHWISKFLVVVMIVAIFLVHTGNGFFVQKGGYEFALLLLASTISLMITGAGKWSIDGWMSGSCCGKCEGENCSH